MRIDELIDSLQKLKEDSYNEIEFSLEDLYISETLRFEMFEKWDNIKEVDMNFRLL